MPIFPGNKLPGYDHSVPPGHIRPFALRRHADTPGERAERQTPNAPPLLNQLPKLLFIHNSHVERTRLLQLAAGLLTR
jgi:hypothetical protein